MITILFIASILVILCFCVYYLRKEMLRLTSLAEEGREKKFFMDNIPDIPILMTANGEIIFSGSQMERYGYLTMDLIGRKLSDLIHPEDRGAVEGLFSGLKDTKDFEPEFRLMVNDGDVAVAWFELRLSFDEKSDRIFGVMREISARKRADDILREKEARYHALSDAAVDSIFVLKNGLYVDINTKTEEIFGIDKDFILGRSPSFFSPEFQPDGERSDEKAGYIISKVLEGESPIFEWVHLRGDGSEFHAEVSLTRVAFRNEYYVLGIVRDISERKKIEKHMTMLAGVVEQAAESVIITDLDGDIEYVNPAFEKSTGYLKEEVIGKKPSILKSGKHDPQFYKNMWDIIAKGEVWRGIVINRNKAGGELIEDSLLSPIRNRDGVVTGFLAVKRDIREEFILQKKLKASESLFRAVFENAPFSMTLNRIIDQRYVAVNPAFIKSAGLDTVDVIGKTSSELGFIISDFDREDYFDRLNKIGTVHNQIMRLIGPDGNEKFIIFSSTKLSFEGEPCILSMSVDITESKKLEERLRQSQKMDAIGQLAGGIAHDFNNMLSGILGGAELLSFLLPSDSPLKKHAETIAKSAGMASELTKKLLAFSRKGASAGMTSLDVHECIRMAVSILERSIDKNIRLELNLSSAKNIIRGEAALLQNVFLNLGINSRDAMKNGGRISFSTSEVFLDEYFCMSNSFSLKPGSYIQVEVSDTGSGIPKKIMERMFEPFFTTKEPGKGTGLGLAAAYGTVKEHGGEISVYSEEGIGTVFKIYLPLLVSSERENSGHDAKVVPGSGIVLLVDDESIVRDVAYEILKSLGYEVIIASGGEEAIHMYEMERGRISIILMDMVMPGISGLEAFRRLKAKFSDAKVVFTSGFSQEGTLIDLSEPGVMGFINKPYRVSDLSSVLAEAIKNP